MPKRPRQETWLEDSVDAIILAQGINDPGLKLMVMSKLNESINGQDISDMVIKNEDELTHLLRLIVRECIEIPAHELNNADIKAPAKDRDIAP